jgi:hypothetical protein
LQVAEIFCGVGGENSNLTTLQSGQFFGAQDAEVKAEGFGRIVLRLSLELLAE